MSGSEITIHVRHPGWRGLLRPYAQTVRQVCTAALLSKRKFPHPGPLPVGEGIIDMAVVLADDAFVQALNHDYRGKDKPTNVLAFAGDESYLGDIILAYETVLREAQAQGKEPKHHAMHLLAHGTLHLLGYDHESDAQARIMEALEVEILEKLGVANPYL